MPDLVRWEIAGETEQGLWCDGCLLPARVRWPLAMVQVDGERTAMGVFEGCTSCDRRPGGMVQAYRVAPPALFYAPARMSVCDRCMAAPAVEFCCADHGRGLCTACLAVHG